MLVRLRLAGAHLSLASRPASGFGHAYVASCSMSTLSVEAIPYLTSLLASAAGSLPRLTTAPKSHLLQITGVVMFLVCAAATVAAVRDIIKGQWPALLLPKQINAGLGSFGCRGVHCALPCRSMVQHCLTAEPLWPACCVRPAPVQPCTASDLLNHWPPCPSYLGSAGWSNFKVGCCCGWLGVRTVGRRLLLAVNCLAWSLACPLCPSSAMQPAAVGRSLATKRGSSIAAMASQLERGC